MYIVPLTPGEVWLGIALFVVVVVVVAIRKSVTEPRRPTDEESREWRERDYKEFKEHWEQYKKEHPEIWDEDGNMHGSPKTTG